jgi:UDP-N-acetylmuramoyl-tripeptide--D-alanyl-D-alanine ligase
MIETIYQHFLKSGMKISTDSRNIIPGSVFFALKGDTFDGNKFAREALSLGASLVVIDNKEYKCENSVLVEDSLIALQQLASLYRKNYEFKVFALTGTNGKTTTKELIKQVLLKKYSCHATVGNFNNHIGVPLTILSAPPKTAVLIIEMGANHQGEIARLCEIADPDYGLITNIGKAHLEGFGGYQGVIKAKTELYRYLIKSRRKIFVNSSDKTLLNIIGDYSNIESYGGQNSCCQLEKIEYDGQLIAHLKINDKKYSIKTHLFGKYNVFNLLAALKVGLFFEVDLPDIIEALESYIPENNRSQILKTNSNTLILDSYNANPSSMESALESFDEMVSANKITILGEMKELGTSSREEHQKIINRAIQLNCNYNFFVGEGFMPFAQQLDHYFSGTKELMDYLQKKKLTGNLIFIKGSRANRLEKIIDLL